MEVESFDFCDQELISSSFSAFQDMRMKGELIDLKVVIQKKRFAIHRVVLAAGIPHLRVMFSSSTNVISLDAIDPEIFEDVKNYAYCGKIKIHAGNVQSLLSASQFLQLTKVHDACVKYAAMQISLNNVFGMRLFAGNIKSLKLAVTCDWYILRNFEAFVLFLPNEFVQLPLPYLKEIVRSDDLNVTKEEKVFEAIMCWVKASALERRILLPDLLTAVRMTLIKPDYLVNKMSKEEFVIKSLPCRNLLEATKNYHLSTEKLPSSVGALSTQPRDASGHGLYALCCSELGHSIDMYDTRKEIWIPLSHVGPKKYRYFDSSHTCGSHNNVVGFNGKIYFFWNFHEVDIFDATTIRRESFEISESSCTSVNNFERVIVHLNNIYAFTENEVFSFDHTLRKWLKLKSKVECCQSGFASLGAYIYITGGFIDHSTTRTCKRFNPDTGIQNNVSPMLCERSSHSCTSLNNMVYVCDFISGEIYNRDTDQWNDIASMIYSKSIISLSAYKGKLYALKEKVTEIYDPRSNTWTLGPRVTPPCKFVTHVIIPSA